LSRKRLLLSAAVLASAPVLLAGCEAPDSGQTPQGLRFPAPGFIADASRGRELFRANCANCHGDDARGTQQGPALTDTIYRPAHHADITFFMAVRFGVAPHHWRFGRMPPVEGLSPEDVGHINAYVREQQRAAGTK
jgi:mono/diheme cytochrome c family protein